MTHSRLMTVALGSAVAGVVAVAISVSAQGGGQEPSPLQRLSRRPTSTMTNPYRMLENWPTLRPGMEWGAAIGLIPDNTGGTWMMFRSEPPINYIDASGTITKSFGEGTSSCRRTASVWTTTATCGPATADRSGTTRRPGDGAFSFTSSVRTGSLLMSLGKAGVSAVAGEDTFIGPTACAVAPNGDILVADGHWPRPVGRPAGRRPASCGSRRTATFITSVGRLGPRTGRVHGAALDWRSTPRVVSSSPIGRPTACRSLDQRSQLRRRVATLRSAERCDDPQQRHADRVRLRVGCEHSRSPDGPRGSRSTGSQSRLAGGRQNRQRPRWVAAALHPRHTARGSSR